MDGARYGHREIYAAVKRDIRMPRFLTYVGELTTPSPRVCFLKAYVFTPIMKLQENRISVMIWHLHKCLGNYRNHDRRRRRREPRPVPCLGGHAELMKSKVFVDA